MTRSVSGWGGLTPRVSTPAISHQHGAPLRIDETSPEISSRIPARGSEPLIFSRIWLRRCSNWAMVARVAVCPRTLLLKVQPQALTAITTRSSRLAARKKLRVFISEGLARTSISSKERSRILNGTSWPGLIDRVSVLAQMPVTRILDPGGIFIIDGAALVAGG